ncbi:MAG: DUF1987 domain-containing protein [Flavobacteriales bacterium]|jgi:hypothetical protein|nr:DUF1987 domain-containing protein [Flavobacteriales bacterium]
MNLIQSVMGNQHLSISGSKNTPEVIWDVNEHSFVFKGVSYPENARKFYDPIFNLAKIYVNDNKESKLNMIIDFEYFNTSTARMLYKIFGLFNEAVLNSGLKVQIDWKYESDDFDMIDSGKDFDFMFKELNFKLIEKAA